MERTITHRKVDENKIVGFVMDDKTHMSLTACVAEAESGRPYSLHNLTTGAKSKLHAVDFAHLQANPDDSTANNINALPIWEG